jgi:hypothetical protein
MSETNVKGDIGEAAFVLEAAKRGYWTGKMPQDCPYDFVLDRKDGKLERVQVKYRTASDKGSISIKLENNSFTNRTTYTENNIDSFAVYVSNNDKVYVIPVKDLLGRGEVTLRVEPPKNNQTKGIILIENFINW